jgi:hypothetical protein
MMDDRWRWERRNGIDITPGPANNPTDDDAYRTALASR